MLTHESDRFERFSEYSVSKDSPCIIHFDHRRRIYLRGTNERIEGKEGVGRRNWMKARRFRKGSKEVKETKGKKMVLIQKDTKGNQ